jgi:hypothetical protein
VSKVGAGTGASRSLFLLFVVFIVVEGMNADQTAHLLQSAKQSLKVASPTASGGRPQWELKAVPCVVIR